MNKLVILYGSQTGTAADVAERLQRHASRQYLPSILHNLNDYPISNLVHETMVVFVVATTGQGDPPDNMTQFWKFILRRNLPANSLPNLRFAVLGLGDSSYLKFNFIAKKLGKRLEQLGGTSVIPTGLADEQHDLGQEFVIEPWIESCFKQIETIIKPTSNQTPIPRDVLLPSKFLLNSNDENWEQRGRVANGAQDCSFNQSNPFHAKMLSNDRVTSGDHWQDVRLIRLDLTDSGIQYKAGDVMVVAPSNPSDDVEKFLELFNLDGDEEVGVTSRSKDTKLPHELIPRRSWRWLAEKYFDICGTPRT